MLVSADIIITRKCPHCFGQGYVPLFTSRKCCEYCRGYGVLFKIRPLPNEEIRKENAKFDALIALGIKAEDI